MRINPPTLSAVARRKSLSRISAVLPATNPTALPAKQRLYCMGVSPKWFWKRKGEAEI